MTRTLTALVLTRNEEKHIARCLESLRGVASQVIIIDSGSTDQTLAIGQRHGAQVLSNPWVNHATQLNWALDHADIEGDWCLRIDADEYLTPALQRSILSHLAGPGATDAQVNGLLMRRIMVFRGRGMRWGGRGRMWVLRMFRTGQARCENRWMDEHLVLLSGTAHRLAGDLVDHPLHNIGWWIDKHNGYATLEAIELLKLKHGLGESTTTASPGGPPQHAGTTRWLKEHLYAKLPTGFRTTLYYLYRYVVLLGFLDGREGAAFHFLHAYWYRLLVDLKMKEMEALASERRLTLETVVRQEYQLKIGP